MPTPAQIAANRLNAQKSSGPRTPSGKAASSRNSLRHGLYAASPVLPSENPEDYRRHVDDLLRSLAPATPIETLLVRRLAEDLWRLRRVSSPNDFKRPNAVLIQAARLMRRCIRTMAILQSFQCSAPKLGSFPQNTPPPPAEIGFVPPNPAASRPRIGFVPAKYPAAPSPIGFVPQKTPPQAPAPAKNPTPGLEPPSKDIGESAGHGCLAFGEDRRSNLKRRSQAHGGKP